jgi:hypothetical protein
MPRIPSIILPHAFLLAISIGVAHPQLIHEFYSRRSFSPAWTNERTAAELRRALKDVTVGGGPRTGIPCAPTAWPPKADALATWPQIRCRSALHCCNAAGDCAAQVVELNRSCQGGADLAFLFF